MKVCVLTNGSIINYNFYENIIKNYDFIICVDGGLEHAYKLKVTPDVIVGDFDSVSKDILGYYKNKNIEIIEYSTVKDYTDTEIAIRFALDKKPDNIDILAGLGTRVDHSLGNIHLLKQILEKSVLGKIINEYNDITLINSSIKLEGKVGDGISLIPLSNKVENVYTKGLAYKVTNGTFEIGHPYGISNYMTQTKASVTIGNGLLLVIKYNE